MSDEWKQGDPFADPEDPAAREREQRRLEREEKRRKREAKRSEKEAAKQPPPPPEPAPPVEPPKPPRTPEQEFWDEDPEPAESPAPDPAKAAAPKPDPEPSPAKPEPEPEAPEPPQAAPAPSPEAPIEQSWEAESPAPPDDDIWGDEGDPSKARAAGRHRGGRRGGGGHGGEILGRLRRHPFRIAGVIVLVLIAWFLVTLFQPLHGDGSGQVQVKVPKGSSVAEVGDLLGERGVIDSSTLFQIRVTLDGKRSSLYAGNFTLAEGMSYGDAIEALSTPPIKRARTVTIPEGNARSQVAQIVEESGIPGSYTRKTVSSKFLDPADYGGKGAKDLEGFLFPNTFELRPRAPVADLVELQLKDFKRQIKKVDMGYARSKNLSVFDVLIIASMIEDESGLPEQRRIVASVIYNRLRDGIPLGIDATTRFATGNYTKPLTESELAIDSPYNTRTNQGLPPGPINSPGLDAIDAAAHPAKTQFTYYVNKPNTCGELEFSKSFDEFEADVAAYNEAREANDGNEPSSC